MPGTKKAILGKKAWQDMVDKDIVEKVHPREATTWSSALHLVPKDGDNVRVTGDFRPLNQLTQLDHYPLPNLRHFGAKLKGCTVFSRLDLRGAFFQIPLSRKSSMKTLTLTPWGPYRYKRLAMELKS